MAVKLVNIGFNNGVINQRIIALVSPGSSPVKRMNEVAKEQGRLIDATCGRRTRSVLVTDSNHVVLSALQPETIRERFEAKESKSKSKNK